MTRKMDAMEAYRRIDWAAVERATEVARTYYVETENGRWFYKMYKPSEAKRIFQATHWRGKIVSSLQRTH